MSGMSAISMSTRQIKFSWLAKKNFFEYFSLFRGIKFGILNVCQCKINYRYAVQFLVCTHLLVQKGHIYHTLDISLMKIHVSGFANKAFCHIQNISLMKIPDVPIGQLS